MTTNAPDLRPKPGADDNSPLKTGAGHQPTHQIPEHEPLVKVLPAGGPLVSSWWTCSICGHSKPGGPPSVCAVEANLLPPHLTVDGCPLNHLPV